ncbi:MAG: dihydroneopterin aldolase, partial [Candidatus Omnitrophica bacterium]|nr:dihydroneopterin aldolase [Candidatus Omnitrophota bacterium]
MKTGSQTSIQINDLKLKVIVGTLPHEREVLQEILANISFEYDASLAAETDALGHAVDYAAIYGKIFQKVAGTKFFLLERLAAFILGLIMEETR